MKEFIRLIGFVSIVVGTTAQSGVMAQPGATEARLKNAVIAGIRVSGLTPAQAKQRLSRELQPKLDRKIVLTDGARRAAKTRRELGVHPALDSMIAHAEQGKTKTPLHFIVDRETLARALKHYAPHFERPALNARIVEISGKVRVQPGQDAQKIDIEASVKQVIQTLEGDAATGTVRLAVDKKSPVVPTAALKGINARLYSFSAWVNPNEAKRAHNIRLAIKSINGKVIPPGHVYSQNETVGIRDHDHGYLTAPIFEKGKTIDGIGGGVSLVTGTLCNAALLAGLPIVEFHTHSVPVKYVPLGRDATVSWGNFDMKFKNNTSAPIYIAYKCVNNRAEAILYGAKPPPQKVTLTVNSHQLAPHHITAELYRTIKQNGKIVKKEMIGRSNYDWTPTHPEG